MRVLTGATRGLSAAVLVPLSAGLILSPAARASSPSAAAAAASATRPPFATRAALAAPGPFTQAKVTIVDGTPHPDPAATPGATFPSITAAEVCKRGYAKHARKVSERTRKAVFAQYGVSHRKRRSYELDHLIPLELGGNNARANLWPELKAGLGGAGSKDKVENALHRRVCAGALALDAAQRQIVNSWDVGVAHPAAPEHPERLVDQTVTPARARSASTTSTTRPATTTTWRPRPLTAPTTAAPLVTAAPVSTSNHPAGTTGLCNDGTYTRAAHSQGACSWHKGLAAYWG